MLTGFQYRAALSITRVSVKDLSKAIGMHEVSLLRYKKTPNLEYVNCHSKNVENILDFFKNQNMLFHNKYSIQLKVNNKSTNLTRFHIVTARIATGLNQNQLSRILQTSPGTLSILENKKNTDIIKTRTFKNSYLISFFNHIGIAFGHDYTVVLNKDPKNFIEKLKC